jgi:hypothetical protein
MFQMVLEAFAVLRTISEYKYDQHQLQQDYTSCKNRTDLIN